MGELSNGILETSALLDFGARHTNSAAGGAAWTATDGV